MAKKRETNPELVPDAPHSDDPMPEEDIPFDVPSGEEGSFTPDTDFDLEDEYKPEPLVAGGNYRGNVIGVALELEQNAIAWKVCLADNGGIMSDGETPVDGSHHYYRNWLPKPGDESEPTSDGRSNKRQSKINMMKRFADGMKVNMNKPKIIAESILNQDWIGIPVIATLSINEYMGVTRNQIDKMVAVSE